MGFHLGHHIAQSCRRQIKKEIFWQRLKKGARRYGKLQRGKNFWIIVVLPWTLLLPPFPFALTRIDTVPKSSQRMNHIHLCNNSKMTFSRKRKRQTLSHNLGTFLIAKHLPCNLCALRAPLN